MKTPEEIEAEALRIITEKVREDYRPTDTDERYDSTLDECYDFSSVGGPFAHMAPSRVLAKVDPVAYSCGKIDWLDCEDIREFDGDEWDGSDLDLAKEAVADDLESQISDKEKEVEEIEAEPVTDENAEPNADRIAELRDELDDLNAILAAVKAYSFCPHETK